MGADEKGQGKYRRLARGGVGWADAGQVLERKPATLSKKIGGFSCTGDVNPKIPSHAISATLLIWQHDNRLPGRRVTHFSIFYETAAVAGRHHCWRARATLLAEKEKDNGNGH